MIELSALLASSIGCGCRTKRESYERRLRALGFTRDFSGRSKKYAVLIHPEYPHKIFLGSAGAIRIGQTATDCQSMTHLAKGFMQSLTNRFSH